MMKKFNIISSIKAMPTLAKVGAIVAIGAATAITVIAVKNYRSDSVVDTAIEETSEVIEDAFSNTADEILGV